MGPLVQGRHGRLRDFYNVTTATGPRVQSYLKRLTLNISYGSRTYISVTFTLQQSPQSRIERTLSLQYFLPGSTVSARLSWRTWLVTKVEKPASKLSREISPFLSASS